MYMFDYNSSGLSTSGGAWWLTRLPFPEFIILGVYRLPKCDDFVYTLFNAPPFLWTTLNSPLLKQFKSPNKIIILQLYIQGCPQLLKWGHIGRSRGRNRLLFKRNIAQNILNCEKVGGASDKSNGISPPPPPLVTRVAGYFAPRPHLRTTLYIHYVTVFTDFLVLVIKRQKI